MTSPVEPSLHPWAPFLHEVQRPSRYLGGEYRAVRKDWASTPTHVALAFPDLYEIGMSHLGLRILYDELNADPRIAAERVFSPWKDLEAQLRTRGLSIVSLESARPLGDFDVVGFSLQYELTFTNVLNLLDLAGLPLRASERGDRHPLVVAGGPVAMQPEPMAPFIDAFLVGDGEGSFRELIETWMRSRAEGIPRAEALVRLARLGGVYCPALYGTAVEPLTGQVVVDRPLHDGVPGRVVRRKVADLRSHPFPARGPVPSTEIVFDRYSLEIARGCTEGCRFCQAGIIYRPVRERAPDEIVRTLSEAIRETGYDEVSLTALSTADFSCISPLVRALMARLKEEKVALGVSSLRAYGLSEDLLGAIGDVRNTSLTFAPEAGSARLRDVVNKNVSDEDIDRGAHAVFSRGWRRCKLYFMIGLPTETDDDVLAIVRVAERYRDIAEGYRGARRAEVTASVSNFVPKPHTPFQWTAMDGPETIARKQGLLQAETKRSRIRLKWHDVEASQLEGIIARGDRRIADVIERAFRAGCRLDGWSQELRHDVWMGCLASLGLRPEEYTGAIPVEARLPWDHIDVLVEKEFLAREYRLALQARRTPPCGKPLAARIEGAGTGTAASRAGADPLAATAGSRDQEKIVCLNCGLDCDLDALRDARRAAASTIGPSPEGGPPGAATAAPAASFERPRTAIVNLGFTRYRLLYRKEGLARFLSHLDLVRMLPRLFRRAGLRMTYSLGFHPKPRVSFGPALALGWAGSGELLDVCLEAPPPPDELLEALRPVAPEGIGFLAARSLQDGDPPLSRVVRAADYHVRLDPFPAEREGAEPADRGEAARLLDRLLEGGSVDLCRVRAGGGTISTPPGALLEARLEPGTGTAFLRLRLDLAPALRPDDLAAALAGSSPPPQAIDRLALWGLDPAGDVVSPLDLERLRPATGPGARS